MPTNIIFTDSLTRSDANPLSGGYTTLTGNSPLQLVSDNVEGTVIGSPNAALYTAGTWPADQGIAILIGALNNTSTIGVLLRGSTSLNTAYICSVTGTTGLSSTWQIQFDNNGAVSTLSNGSMTPSIGDTLYAFVQGSLITFQQNGITLGTATDSNISTGDAGLYANPATVLGDVIISAPVQGFDFISVSITPTSLNIVPGGQTTFAQVVAGQGVSTSNVTWFVNGVSGGNSTVGTISVAGLYTAPASVPIGGSVTVTAQSQADNFISSAGTVAQIYKNVFAQSYAPNDARAVADFKTACTQFSQILPTLGWTQVPLSVDPGQVQWANFTTATFKTTLQFYFNQQNQTSGLNWAGTWVSGTSYTGSFSNNPATNSVVVYGDANYPTLTWAAVSNSTFNNQYTSLTQVIVNTAQSLPLASVATSAGGNAVYTGTIGGGTNTYIAYIFVVTGFALAQNNGTFVCTASTPTTITLSNSLASAQSASATATSLASNVGYLGSFSGNSASNGWAGLSAGTNGFVAAGGTNNINVMILGSSTNTFGGTPVSGSPTNEVHAGNMAFAPPSSTINTPYGTTGVTTISYWAPYLYEIYQSTDSLSATCPIYLKIQYSLPQPGQGASLIVTGLGNSRTAITITVGTALGANGSINGPSTGLILGNIAQTGMYWIGSNTAPLYTTAGDTTIWPLWFSGNGVENQTGSVVPQECDFSGNAGNLRVCLFRQSWQQGNGAPLYFAIERAKDPNGNDLDTYFTVLTNGYNGNQSGATLSGNFYINGNSQSTVFKPGTGSFTTGTVWRTVTFNLNTMAYQGMIPVFPIFPTPGYVGNPMMGTVVVGVNDAITGELIRCTIYGQTHTYLIQGSFSSLIQNAGNPGGTAQNDAFGVPAMLWENF